ncbi:hypothetical protein QZH41_020179, partial [Actinostola sp. cb2023]
MDSLGYKPQKEIAYNRLLPYTDQLDQESNRFIAEIKYNLSRAVVFKESNPGILYWSNQLSSYMKCYGRKFSKEDHINFIKLFYELITTPQLDPQYVNGYGHVLIRLLKKRKLISRDDLTLPWRPLYDAVEFMFYSKFESVGLKKHTEYKYQEFLKLVVMFSRVLWFDEMMGIWKAFQNPGRMWEEDCLKLLARLARDNIGYIDWNPYIPMLTNTNYTIISVGVRLREVSAYGRCPLPGGVRFREVSASGRCPLPGGACLREVSANGRCPLTGGVRLREVSAYERCPLTGGVRLREVPAYGRCPLTGGVRLREVSAYGRCPLTGGVRLREVPAYGRCPLTGGVRLREVSAYGRCPLTGGVRLREVSAYGRCPLTEGVRLREVSAYGRCPLLREVAAYGRCPLTGGVRLREVSAYGRCPLTGGVRLREVFAYGRCPLTGGVRLREVSAYGRCPLTGGVRLREVSAYGRCPLTGGVRLREVSAYGRCPLTGGVRSYGRCPLLREVSAYGRCPLTGGVRLREVSAYGRCPLLREVSADGRCPLTGGARLREVSAYGRCPLTGGVRLREVSAYGRCSLTGGVRLREVSAYGRCPLTGGVRLREVSAYGRCPLTGGVRLREVSACGRFKGKLQKLLLKMSSEVIKRLHREKFSEPSWQTETPQDKKLSDNDINQFVESLKPAVMLAIFNKFGSFDAANSLQHLAMMKPDLVLPTLLDKLYTALDTLIEPHQLTATLNCVTSVARAMVKSDGSYPAGKSHVLPLLQLILPGIDPNDFRKAVATFTFISTIISLVPVVDCSEAVGVVEMTDEEKELCLTTSQFEDFVLQFMDRCFSLIESSSFENVSELDSSLFKSDQRHSQEGIIGMGVASTFHAILMQSSPQIYKVALQKLFNFCSTNVLEMKVAGKIAADMCRAAAKTNPDAALKKFLPHCCSIIEGITSVEGMKHEEETDDQLLWNLQIFSEIVRTNGSKLLSYKEDIKKVIKSTIHLKNKEAATVSAKLLENLLRPLSYIYPLEWKSVLEDFGQSPAEHLFIRDWGKSGDLNNLNIQWHIPSKEETLFAKEILDNFLQPEMKRVESFIAGSETLAREELQQSLRVIQGCLSGGVLLLPSWNKPPLTNIGTKTMVNRGRFRNTVCMPSTGNGQQFTWKVMSQEIVEVHIIDFLFIEHLLCHREDDTKALQFIVKIYESLLLHLIGQRDEFDVRWRGAGAVKRAMEDKLAGKKKHVRALLIERVQLQHEMRILDNVSSQMTTLHKVLLDDLFTLATSEYTEVRIKAQKVMGMCIEVFDYYARSLFPTILNNLKDNDEVSHEAFKVSFHHYHHHHHIIIIVYFIIIIIIIITPASLSPTLFLYLIIITTNTFIIIIIITTTFIIIIIIITPASLSPTLFLYLIIITTNTFIIATIIIMACVAGSLRFCEWDGVSSRGREIGKIAHMGYHHHQHHNHCHDRHHHDKAGVLHILLNNRMFYLVNHYWEIMKDIWPAIIQANHSEKPTITTLISSLGDKMIKKHDTVAIIRQVPDSAVQFALAIMNSTNPAPKTCKGDPSSPVQPTDTELAKAAGMYQECNEKNLRNYNELVEKLTSLLENENLRWRYLQLCFNFLRTLIRYDQPMPSRTVAVFVSYLNHDALAIRKMAISTVGSVLKQQKRPHAKIEVNPYAIAEVPEPTGSVIQPGDRPDNLWLHFVSDNLPETQECWDRCTFIDKTHWGYYTWPKKMLTYAPSDQQPALGRKREALSESEREIFDRFSQEEFVEKFIEFLSLEDRKGKDKFSVNRFLLFKESSQRCAVEIIAALIRGSKHWTFAKTEAMWNFLIPLLRKAIPSITVESLEDWGTCMATAVESRDPRRIHWLLNALLDEPLSGDDGALICSFADASRLYLIQGALCQQEWRVAELLNKLLSLIQFRLGHSYKNVRDRSGSVLCSIFMYDIQLPHSLPTRSPRREDFVNGIIPRLDCLTKLTTIDDGSNPTAGVDMAKVKEGSVESEAVRLLKTITNWLLTHAVRALNSCSQEFFSLLPYVVLFDSQEEDPELQHHCRNTVSYMAQVELPIELLPRALESVKKIASQNLWYARKSILSYLQLMVFTNQFYITRNPSYIQEIRDLLLGLLLDERLEVREMAADTFSGLLHYGIFTLGKDTQDKFRKMANTKLSKKRKAGASSDNGSDESARLLKRHAGVLGLACCVKAFPYDVPSWLPEMVIELGDHLHDPIPIE